VKQIFFYLLFLSYLLLNTRVLADTPIIKPEAPTTAATELPSGQFSVFPVGLNVGQRNVNPSVLIRGKEDGLQAINFENWLLPYDAVIQTLKLNVTTLPDGQLEVRSPGVVTRIDPKNLRTDPELGLVFSIQDLKTLFGVASKFDIKEYAIVLDIPWLNQNSQNVAQKATPIQLAGLPVLKPSNFGLTAIEQTTNISGTASTSPNYKGDLMAIGTALGGSWFIRADQADLAKPQTWRLAEAQFLKPGNKTDYILGSQPPFWIGQTNNGDYWGFTVIQRQGFVPPQSFGGYLDPRQRLQAAQIGRTITGRSEPGTLVRLVEAFGDRVIAEVLVDSSGIYRFDNIKSEQQFLSSNYRVFLYPQGRLTAPPEIREATYSIVPGQIPAGASALVISGGLRRSFRSDRQNLIGDFSDFRGGIAERIGLSQDLSVGIGGIYDDQSFRGMGELFWRPANFPLQVAVSALSGARWDVISDIRYDPTPSLSAAFTSDRLSNRFNVNWNLLPGFSLFGSTDSQDATALGVQVNFSSSNAYTFARASLDTENRLRWNLLQRLGQLEIDQRGNEIGTLSEITYNLSSQNYFDSGNSLLLSYETRNQNRDDNLLTLGWRYRSRQRAIDGNYLWEAELGCGVGSRGTAPVATLATTVLPGLLLRGRYQGVSLTTDESTFSVDLVSSLNVQRGIRPGDRRSDYFRTQGGLLLQPFFDRNHNGKRDPGEEIYHDNAESLFVINNQAIKSLQPEVQRDRTLVRLPPGTYRLDLDPAGFPPDWQAASEAMAVNVVAGSYTTVMIPLIRSYTRSGVITDAQGNAIAGARVEAMPAGGGKRRFSVTNGAGVYYLEGLQQGNYLLQVNGKSAGNLNLEASSIAFQELNFKQP